MTQTAEQTELSPRLKIRFLGNDYTGINNFHVTGSVLDIYNGFSFDLPNPDNRVAEIIKAEPHRWHPIKIWHSDPLVNAGHPRPLLTGLVTGANLNVQPGSPSTLSLKGYDCGKLLDSCGPAWKRIQSRWKQLVNTVIDKSWLHSQRTDDWGLKEVVDYDLNRNIKKGRFAAQRAYTQQVEGYMPPLQIGVGESVYAALSRFARLTGYTEARPGGSIVNVSAEGHIQLFNPDDTANDPASYSIDLVNNPRFKGAELILTGEPLRTSYAVFGSVIIPAQTPDSENPNEGKFYNASYSADHGQYLGGGTIERSITASDGEAYTDARARARAEWMRRRAEFDAETIQITLAGHAVPAAGNSTFGPGGSWLPLVEGNIVDLNAPQLLRFGRHYLEAVDLYQRPPPQGTYAVLRLKKVGLLSS
jgi:hypothetical protein